MSTKRVLSLDGGGVRGILTIAFLERIEKFLNEKNGAGGKARIVDHFDLIGGTSTGAIISSALTLGLSMSEIRGFYFQLAPRIFKKSFFRLKLLQSSFDAKTLKEELDQIVGDMRLESPDLLTNMAIVMKRMDTGSAWIVTNNAKAKYWDDPPDQSYIGNRHYRIADLVRASTAAPYYFNPHEIEITEGEAPGLFVDGAISPHNNPALALFHVATIPAYGFRWPTGRDKLHIISIGTGARRERLSAARARRLPAVGLAVEALKSMVEDSSKQVMSVMQTLGHTDTPWEVDSEIGDLRDVLLPGEPLFTFQRYDVRLERDWLHEELDILLTEKQIADARLMENAAAMPIVYQIGQAAAEKYVRREHLNL